MAWVLASRVYNIACVDYPWACHVQMQMGGTEMVLHHLGSLLSVATALLTGDGHMHTLWMLSTEFTTPLINNRWWLDKMVSACFQRVWGGVQESHASEGRSIQD